MGKCLTMEMELMIPKNIICRNLVKRTYSALEMLAKKMLGYIK